MAVFENAGHVGGWIAAFANRSLNPASIVTFTGPIAKAIAGKDGNDNEIRSQLMASLNKFRKASPGKTFGEAGISFTEGSLVLEDDIFELGKENIVSGSPEEAQDLIDNTINVLDFGKPADTPDSGSSLGGQVSTGAGGLLNGLPTTGTGGGTSTSSSSGGSGSSGGGTRSASSGSSPIPSNLLPNINTTQAPSQAGQVRVSPGVSAPAAQSDTAAGLQQQEQEIRKRLTKGRRRNDSLLGGSRIRRQSLIGL